jgi:hypothetical protein
VGVKSQGHVGSTGGLASAEAPAFVDDLRTLASDRTWPKTEERSLDAKATHNATGLLTLNPSHVVLRWRRGRPIDACAMSAARSAQSAKVRICVDFPKHELAHGDLALWKTWGIFTANC